MAVCLVLKRAELIDAGAMDGLIAWEDHVKRVDIRFVCVRLSCDSGLCLMKVRASFVRRCDVWGVSGLWRSFVRFGYMAHTPTVTRKYGNYRGFT